jgi:RNA polymerase sigma-70 factor (ECF subfamily)
MISTSQQAREIINACAESGSTAAWQAFVQHFRRLIAGVALRSAARWGDYSPDAVDDLVQETFLKLCAERCRLLREFQEDHPDAIYGYIKVITANLVNDYYRAQRAGKRGGGAAVEEITAIQCSGDPRREGSPFTIQREILLDQVEACVQRCTQGESRERDQLVFRLYYRQGFTAKAISALPQVGLSVKGVESVILRVTRLAKAELNTEAKFAQEPGLKTVSMKEEKGFATAKPFMKGENK